MTLNQLLSYFHKDFFKVLYHVTFSGRKSHSERIFDIDNAGKTYYIHRCYLLKINVLGRLDIMKKLLNVALMMMIVMGSASVVCATNTGDNHALEGMFGAKYSGAPSQALAGKLGLLIDGLKDDLMMPFLGKITNPEPLKTFGYNVTKGDPIELKRIEEHKWELKLMNSGKIITFKVNS